jgi:hypothetical protein
METDAIHNPELEISKRECAMRDLESTPPKKQSLWVIICYMAYAILSKIQYKLKKTEISDAEKDFETA